MTTYRHFIWNFGIIILFIACNTPTLEGHYHLVWNKNNEQFQTWNIRDNRMKINEEVCSNSDSCFSSVISFSGNTITINPWVDIEYNAHFKIDEQGIVTMYGDNDTLQLIPHQNCISARKYFENKTKHITDSFNLLPGTMTGVAKTPESFENELIIGYSSNAPFYIFNDHQIRKPENWELEIKKVNDENVWVHVDNHVPIQLVLPIIKELFKKGYSVQYSTIQERENNEQIELMDRTFTKFKTTNERYEIDYCEFCTKHPTNKIDSIVNIKMIASDLLVLNGDTNNLFQTRNSLVRYIIQNRTTRLYTQIQMEINGSTPFSDYLALIDELRFAHIETSSIIYYKGKDDPDANWIREKQEDYKSHELLYEFPMRIKEIIKITTPNKRI